MADVEYTIIFGRALRYAVQAPIAAIAAEIAATAAGLTPVDQGTLAGSYSTQPGDDPGTTWVIAAPVPHGKYVEYGTRRMRASAPLGRAVASARARYGR